MGKKRSHPPPPMTCTHCGKIVHAVRFIASDGRDRGWFLPKKYCSLSCNSVSQNAARQARAAGKYLDKSGYVILTNGKKQGYKPPEHRVVMERMIGRPLHKHETVHHKNGTRSDNRPENLELWAGRHGRGQRTTDLEPDIWSGMIPSYQINAEV